MCLAVINSHSLTHILDLQGILPSIKITKLGGIGNRTAYPPLPLIMQSLQKQIARMKLRCIVKMVLMHSGHHLLHEEAGIQRKPLGSTKHLLCPLQSRIISNYNNATPLVADGLSSALDKYLDTDE